MRQRIAAGVAAVALVALAWFVIDLRHRMIHAITTYDSPPREPAPLPAGMGPGLAQAPRVRVALLDGLSAQVAAKLPAWSAVCNRGIRLVVDVGFPTVSLPVETALWSGLTQQQTGIVFRSDRPIVPPLADTIPAHVPTSIAIAESHGYIVRSLGFHTAEPTAGDTPATDADPKGWAERWQDRAREVVTSDARLVFVHVLRVDDAGHAFGGDSPQYRAKAEDADAILGKLVESARDARWFVLSDHGHIASGGHGGEEPEVRQVEGCIAGPGIAVARGGLVHVVDVARAIADSTGTTLDRKSFGRPMSAALVSPLEPDQALPRMELAAGAIAIFVLVAGLGLSSWGVRRWWIAPWWFVLACASLFVIRGEPTMSMPMIYKPRGDAMFVTWLPALALAAASVYVGLARTTLSRVLVAQLALPIAAAASVISACSAWPVVIGDDIAPVVPRFTAWTSPLLLITAHGALAVALAVLARLARQAFGRREPAGTPRTAPAGG
jgi:hypothetical protein